MKVLVTGACGFVGSELIRAILHTHPTWEVVGIDNFSRAGSWLNKEPLEKLGVRLIHGDIRNESDLENLPAVNWVIDAAANPSVLAGIDGKSSSRQLVEHNLHGTINLLEFCKRHGAGFILLSTSRVYSIPPLVNLKVRVENEAFVPDADQIFPAGLSPNGVSEAFTTSAPVSLYGATKLASEQLALEYGHTFGFPVWINRCGVLAGAGQFGHPAQGIFAFWIHSFREGRPLKYIGFGGSGHQVRDCLHPRDLVSLLEKQAAEPIETTKPRITNFAGGIGNSMSLANLTAWSRRRFPESPTTVAVPTEERRFDIPWMVLDASSAKTLWGWQPHTAVQDVCEEIAGFADDHPDWLAVTMR